MTTPENPKTSVQLLNWLQVLALIWARLTPHYVPMMQPDPDVSKPRETLFDETLYLPIVNRPPETTAISTSLHSSLVEASAEIRDMLGVGVVQYAALRWNELQNADGSYNYDLMDEQVGVINNLLASGNRVIVQFFGTAEFAQIYDGNTCSPFSAEDTIKYQQFIQEVLSRINFGPHGQSGVILEFWNEPEVPYYMCLPGYFGGFGPQNQNPTPQDYYEAGFEFGQNQLRPLYEHFNAQGFKIISPGFMLDDMVNHAQFLIGIRAAELAGPPGKQKLFDAVGIHNYQYMPYLASHEFVVADNNWPDGLKSKIGFIRDYFGEDMNVIVLEIGGMCILYSGPEATEELYEICRAYIEAYTEDGKCNFPQTGGGGSDELVPPLCSKGTIFDHYKGRYYIVSLLDYLEESRVQNSDFTIFSWYSMLDGGWKTVGLQIGTEMQDSAFMVDFFLTLFYGQDQDVSNTPPFTKVDVSSMVSYYEFPRAGALPQSTIRLYVAKTQTGESLPVPAGFINVYDSMGNEIEISGDTFQAGGLPIYFELPATSVNH